jgi:peptidoglycan hydrolase-like protein with peptidoglycan-binding domain
MTDRWRRGWVGGWLAAGMLAVAMTFAAGAQSPRPVAETGDPRVQEAQSVLQLLGLFNTRTDGRMGPRTREALEAFQRQQRLPVTGQVDDRTLASLRQLRDTRFSGQLGGARPDPPPRQVEPPAAIRAQPVERVETRELAPAQAPGLPGVAPADPGPRPSAAPRPPVIGGPPPPLAPPTPFAPVANPPPAPPPAPVGPFGLLSWDWLIPLAGIPLFAILWRLASRRPTDRPNDDGPGGGRREPSVAGPARGDGPPVGIEVRGLETPPPPIRDYQPRLRRQLGKNRWSQR